MPFTRILLPLDRFTSLFIAYYLLTLPPYLRRSWLLPSRCTTRYLLAVYICWWTTLLFCLTGCYLLTPGFRLSAFACGSGFMPFSCLLLHHLPFGGTATFTAAERLNFATAAANDTACA